MMSLTRDVAGKREKKIPGLLFERIQLAYERVERASGRVRERVMRAPTFAHVRQRHDHDGRG